MKKLFLLLILVLAGLVMAGDRPASRPVPPDSSLVVTEVLPDRPADPLPEIPSEPARPSESPDDLPLPPSVEVLQGEWSVRAGPECGAPTRRSAGPLRRLFGRRS